MLLHQSGELDNNLMPLGKESVLPVIRPDPLILDETMRPGTTKRRQELFNAAEFCERFIRDLDRQG